MDEVQDLYQELLLDHYRRPRNRRRLDTESVAEGHNPLCGDRVKVYVQLDGEVIKDVAFEGSGCAISTASASLMTEAIKGKTVAEAKALFNRFHALVTSEYGPSESRREHPVDGSNGAPGLGKLEVFSGVGKYPARVKCATLAWHTVNAALDHRHETVSTE
jgi:nitrogen fixation NifU-like protein